MNATDTSRKILDAVDADPSRRLIEEYVAAVLDAPFNIQRAVAMRPPAMEFMAAEHEDAVTGHAILRRGDARLDGGQRQAAGKGRHAVLQLGEFIGDVHRQQIAPGRQRLAEFDEHRAQFLQRQP